MAISNGGVVEVDLATGDDTNNAGYFNSAGAGAGTDYSLPANGPLTFSDLVIDATTNTKIKSSGTAATTAWFRNGLRITTNTGGWTAGLYEVLNTAIDGNGFVTLDRSPAATGTSGGAGHLGGPLASIGGFAALIGTSSGHTVFIKYNASPYQHSSSQNVAGGRWNTAGCAFVGYDTTRTLYNTDANRPTLNANAATMTMITMSSIGTNKLHNLILDNASSNSSVSLASLASAASSVRNCTFKRSTSTGLTLTGTPTRVYNCLFDTCSGTSALVIQGNTFVENVWVKDCSAGEGINFNGSVTLAVCVNVLVAPFTGSLGAFYTNSTSAYILTVNCTAYVTTGSNNAPFSFANQAAWEAIRCLAVGANGTAYGFYDGVVPGVHNLRDCAGFDNNSGDQNIAAPGIVTGFVTLSADPFVDASSNDFRLNTTAGGGASCRGIGFAYPGQSVQSYPDIGALQALDPYLSGGAVSLINGGVVQGNL